MNLLKCVCYKCSRLLVTPTPELLTRYNNRSRFEVIKKMCSKVKCCGTHNKNGCGAPQPTKYSKDLINFIKAEWKGQAEKKNGPPCPIPDKLIKLKASEFQIISSSAILDICIEQTETAYKKSNTKSRSDTVSIELLVGLLNPSFLVV